MSSSRIVIGKYTSQKTGKEYKAIWEPKTKKIYIEKTGDFFSSPTFIDMYADTVDEACGKIRIHLLHH